jgi:hypothetical protein
MTSIVDDDEDKTHKGPITPTTPTPHKPNCYPELSQGNTFYKKSASVAREPNECIY